MNGDCEKALKCKLTDMRSIHDPSRSFFAASLLTIFLVSGCLLISHAPAEENEKPDEPTTLSPRTKNRLVKNAMRQLVLPSVDFHQTPLDEAMAELQTMVVKLDTSHGLFGQDGLRIALADEIDPKTTITMRLKDAPLYDAVRYTAALAAARVVFQEGKVLLDPVRTPVPLYTTEVYSVDESTVERLTGGTKAIREALVAAGIPFPPGTAVAYSADTQKLIIRNTEDAQDLVDAWLSGVP